MGNERQEGNAYGERISVDGRRRCRAHVVRAEAECKLECCAELVGGETEVRCGAGWRREGEAGFVYSGWGRVSLCLPLGCSVRAWDLSRIYVIAIKSATVLKNVKLGATTIEQTDEEERNSCRGSTRYPTTSGDV